jgi:hypothetical protein
MPPLAVSTIELVAQCIRVYSLKIISLSATSLRITEAYLVVNFRISSISRGTRNLVYTPTVTKIKIKN